MHTNSDNIGILIGNETDDIIDELYDSILQRYKKSLEESMKGSGFIFDGADLLHYKSHRISLNRGGSYIDSLEWLKNKKGTIIPKTNDDRCIQYAVSVALNHQNIKNNTERIARIKLFINQYNWKEINFPSHKKDWRKFESNYKSIALNSLFVSYNGHAYKSKYNLKRENQVILLMITDGEQWHYLAVKELSVLLRGRTSNDFEDFYCLNCLHSFRTENKLKKHENICKNYDYCYIEMPKENNKLSKYNNGEKSMKVSFIIYADLESSLEKINTCYDTPKKSTKSEINLHTTYGYSLFIHCSFDITKKSLILIETNIA